MWQIRRRWNRKEANPVEAEEAAARVSAILRSPLPAVATWTHPNDRRAAGWRSPARHLPVYASGALFSAGGTLGHGEVDLSAIETGLRGRFQFIVRKDMEKITRPRRNANPLDRHGPQTQTSTDSLEKESRKLSTNATSK
jgi:hypothetical protein